ncbi:MAG: bifunctional 4-hydroxy-2-oxoglutarate aldolase/2-dehydro-3-deoxy-phosphogluconate aldolase [Lachnospiraceae bacterium]|nr:bifunctional 4-hydroxy-2-oxoglutarate aldolase/2-dehydro-3-deoxy-phosphogluconate aldolase [Lachnospiraceae bacterium]
MGVLEKLEEARIIPVVVIEDVKNAVPAAQAILAGGIGVMEITFRTDAAADSIRAVKDACPDMLVGAGTVTTLEQCRKALECGAQFIVSPGYDEEIVKYCVDHDIAVTPGCVTPTEIMAAMKQGLRVLKFFPAGVYGGLKAIKALSAPFAGVRFIPTGGINAENLREYLDFPGVFAVGGTWICTKKDVSEGNFEKITELCREALSK